MPVQYNPDGSMRYVEQPQEQQRPDIVVPQNRMPLAATQPAAQQQQQIPPQRQQEPPERPPIDMSPLGRPPIDDTMLEEHTALQNVAGGYLSGVFNKSLPASGAVHIESWLDLPTRAIVTDENGDFVAPWKWQLKTPSEYVGVPADMWETWTPQQRRNALSKKTDAETAKTTGANTESISYVMGQFAGMLTDPAIVTPVAAGTALTTRMATGAAVGAADLGLYESAHEGGVTAGGVFLGASLGGAIGAFTRIKPSIGHKDPKVRERAATKIAALGESINRKVDTGKFNMEQALTASMKEFKLDQNGLSALMENAGHWSTRYKTHPRGERGIIDALIEPVSVRIKEISEPLWMNMNNTFRKIMDKNRVYEGMVDSFVRKTYPKLHRMDAKIATDLKKALLIGKKSRFDAAMANAAKINPKIVKDYADYDLAMKDMWKMLKDVRKHKSTTLGKQAEVYLHRAVKDVKAMHKWIEATWGKAEVDRLSKIVKKEYPDGASDAQLGKIYRDFVSGFYDAKGMKVTPKGSKYRRITEEDFDKYPELVDMFHDPLRATHSYIKETVDDFYKKKFFGGKIVEKFGDEVGDPKMWEMLAKDYKIGSGTKELEELKNIFNAVFIQGSKTPHKVIRDFKQLTYAGLLGNPISAVTQVGDIFIAAAKYGPITTMQGLFKTVLGRGMSPKEMGLMETMLEEFVGTGIPHKVLTSTLNWGGFRSVDQLGKAVNMTSAVVKAQKMAKTSKGILALRNKWGKAFGDDFDNLIKDLRTFKPKAPKSQMSEHVKALAFAELADIQPITVMEMPMKYLTVPNGRIWYMLKTFQLKFFNVLRQHFWYELKRGNPTAAIKSGAALMGMYTLGGVSTDAMKNAMLGKDFYADDAFWDHMVRGMAAPLGLDRYSTTKLLSSSDPVPKFIENILPPVGFYSPQVATAFKFSDKLVKGEGIHIEDMSIDRWINQIPVLGKLVYNWGGNNDDWNYKRWGEKT